MNEYGREIPNGYHFEPVRNLRDLAEFLTNVSNTLMSEVDRVEERMEDLIAAIDKVRENVNRITYRLREETYTV